MPYRDQATVESWVDEFRRREPIATDVSVLEKDFQAGPDSGLVVVSLRTASTVTYIQAVVTDGTPHWVVTFEARPESFDLDAAGVAALAHDLDTLARLCEHLQDKTDAALSAR
ncbi:protein-L-isoaspartate carboxylmethyltransferase [Microbacterium fluvii]|uniref:Protein-L-isoaspartate carboxylmethyltransferase n=1 Tax=Microbacterium fluvii TaxID=415215 RepID=A0ABW2HDD2_9MICO|nr:protein-L-isoaspartate carboxylmethyltransferase [Microbacterium fluvii]MCU4672989.1 protein-L-isoaspartate carboxylmethyltransferase [Microbacterium fluvii]